MWWCSPQKRVIVTGDLHNPRFPGFIDSYPQLWPKAIDSIATLEFDHILPGHGPVEHDRRGLIGRRNFIEEIHVQMTPTAQFVHAVRLFLSLKSFYS